MCQSFSAGHCKAPLLMQIKVIHHLQSTPLVQPCFIITIMFTGIHKGIYVLRHCSWIQVYAWNYWFNHSPFPWRHSTLHYTPTQEYKYKVVWTGYHVYLMSIKSSRLLGDGGCHFFFWRCSLRWWHGEHEHINVIVCVCTFHNICC